MDKLIVIDRPDKMRKPLIIPWVRHYKCKDYGYFFDGEYGYFGINSYAKDSWNKWRNIALSWFGLVIEWRCDGTGKSRIRKRHG